MQVSTHIDMLHDIDNRQYSGVPDGTCTACSQCLRPHQRGRVLHQALPGRAVEGASRVRQLRRGGPAAQARARRRCRRRRNREPPGCRSAHHRRCDRGDQDAKRESVIARGGGCDIRLILVIFSLAWSGRSAAPPFAVAAYIGGAYFFTASTSFANPAVTIARMFSDTFAGIDPAAVPGFIAAQLVGAALAVCTVRYLYPNARRLARDVVVPHAPRSAQKNESETRSALRVRAQRRAQPDRRRAARSLRGRPRRRSFGRKRTHRRDQPGRRRGDVRGRPRPLERVSQADHGRRGAAPPTW